MTTINRPLGVRVSLAALAMLGSLASLPAYAEPTFGNPMSHSEELRRLDIMLMVTGLRCRNTADDFQADFQTFEAHHLTELNDAVRTLKADLARDYGAREAEGRMDRISVAMANQYGNGHPWLGCGELKSVARDLATADGEAPLIAAAEELLHGDAPLHADPTVLAVADAPQSSPANVTLTQASYAPH